ncbi:uncharacterized protein UBRO_02925 [Ustilago bromivora]|uniref:SAGA-associated factor 11 n=1 Tax=Ustilago bromivora TaxID=307758 RepID=A0A1K0H5B8_9BASI|nr:uncharacterized protein UBRO_02925 [Ustilago bromivora]SYW77886.1 uncharacterized protein UBRO2_02078 [Ustilago bromivora]
MSDPKALIATKFLDSFLTQIVLDVALSTHSTIKRARSICKLCGIRCQTHTPAAEQCTNLSLSTHPHTNNSSDSTISTSRSSTPVPGGGAVSKPDYYSNNPLFECLVCSRQVSSNRYATHLAKCMGMGSKGGRKGAARNAKATTTGGIGGLVANGNGNGNGSGSRRGTPKYSSDMDEDAFASKKKGKNGGKRSNSPIVASRMNKRIKTSSPTPPPGETGRSFSSHTFAPSGLSNSTVISGSPLNPNNTTAVANKKANSNSKLGDGESKRKRDEEDEEEGGESGVGSGGSNGEGGEEGEISDDDEDEDEDVALASRPAVGSGTKIKIPLRTTPRASTGKQKTFTIIDDSDQDSYTNLNSQRRSGGKVQAGSEDEEGEDDDEEDEDEDDDVQVTRVSHSSVAGAATKKKTSGGAAGGNGLQRERGSDGEFVDVESAGGQSDADSF